MLEWRCEEELTGTEREAVDGHKCRNGKVVMRSDQERDSLRDGRGGCGGDDGGVLVIMPAAQLWTNWR